MSLHRKILLIWALLQPPGILLALLYPKSFDGSSLTNYAARTLVATVSFYLFRRDTDKGARAIFFNFFLFFGAYSVCAYAWWFMRERLLRLDPYADVYANQYNWALYFFLLSLCIVYVFVDSVLEGQRLSPRYLVTIFVVGSIWGYLFYPYFENPRYLYTTPDIKDYKALDTALESLRKEGKEHPTMGEISSSVRLYTREGEKILAELSGAKKEQRIAELLPYMEGLNYSTLLYKPLHLNCVYLSLLCLLLLALYFVYHYMYDPPKRAYFEKIVLLFLLYCALEALHLYAFSASIAKETLSDMITLGRYLSVGATLMLLWVFSLRLKFVLSTEGKFYERHLLTDPKHITRWRDAFDNWIVRKFLNPEILERRFLLRREPKS